MDATVSRCIDDKGEYTEGYTFNPENAAYADGNAMPFRVYRIAVPGKVRPSVSVSDSKTVPLGKPFCKNASIKYSGVSVGEPYFRDGLWIVDVNVPLYVRAGALPALRSKFRLSVESPAGASGTNPGSRALSRVDNPKAAKYFGVSQSSRRKALRRSASSELSDVNFLAEILVGDKDIATTTEDGLYAVSFGDLRIALQEQGREKDLYGIPVEKIRMYAASPDTLTEMVPGASLLEPSQIFEIPIEVRDHSGSQSKGNGTFDEGDSIVFVGYGKNFWKRCDRVDPTLSGGKMDYYYSVSPYSFYQHFLFGWSDTKSSARMGNTLKAPSGSGSDIEWLRYVRAEKDVFLRDAYFGKEAEYEAETGKEWFWAWHHRDETTELSDINLQMPQTTNLKGLVEGGKQFASVSFFPHRSVWATNVDGKKDQTQDLTLSGESYTSRMSQIHFSFDINGTSFKDSDLELLPGGNFRIDKPELKKSGNKFTLTMLPNDRQYDRFDGYSLAYQWNPSVDSAEWLLPGKVSGIVKIPVGKTSGIRVMKFVDMIPVGLLNISDGVAKDSIPSESDVRYLAYKADKPMKPAKITGIVPNVSGVLNNISRINSATEYLIISPKEFAAQSVQLGKFRSDGTAISTIPTTVVSAEDIYRMYTGGEVSPVALRNYIAYAYSVCPELKYVLLVGHGHFDYKNVLVQGKSFLPPYEIEDAVVEDFFAALDSGEAVRYGTYDLDVAVGRLPVTSSYEMSNYISKAKEYEEVGKFDHGVWRSNVLLTADDAMNGNVEDHERHTLFEEEVAIILDSVSEEQGFRWNLKKVYLVDYSYDGGGQKKSAQNDFLSLLNQGALITNYFGHGSKTDWASEGLLKVGYIPRLSNRGRYTILNSFSCTVARFDDGKDRSLSEEFMLAANAGSIASIGATRETLAPQNKAMGKSIMANALSTSGITYGESFKKTKNDVVAGYSGQRYNNERYVYIGEPVIRMPIAENKVSLDQKLDTIRGLDNMKFSGSVSGMDNGFVHLALREGRVKKKLPLGVILSNGIEDSVEVTYEGSLLYSEEVPVKSGRFATEFVTPKKLNFGDTAAEFTAWAYSSKMKTVARVLKSGIQISGMSAYADSIHDDLPPRIRMQPCYTGVNETFFANGQHVKMQSPACLQIVIEDSTALDFREQADEGISFEVVGVEDPYHPSPFIEQTSKRAVLRKTFTTQNYPEGTYEFRVYAYDVLGNASMQVVNLEITGELKDGLVDVFNIPNPVGKKGTTFYFKDLALAVNRPSTVNIFIYNQNGRLVKVIKNAVSGVTHWDGRDNHGRKLANGLYHYVVRSEVPATDDFKKSTWTKKQKLLISR